jgi:hypothetical protein
VWVRDEIAGVIWVIMYARELFSVNVVFLVCYYTWITFAVCFFVVGGLIFFIML